MLRFSKTEIQGSNYWLEASTFSIRKNPYGPNLSVRVPPTSSGNIRIKKAYYLSMRLGLIYHQCRHKDTSLTRPARWYDEVDKSGFLAFGRVDRSTQTHYQQIINFFDKRSTNAASESFNAKIKNFRSQFRGVKDKAFFLFRLCNIYA